jgi:hypothetical protein
MKLPQWLPSWQARAGFNMRRRRRLEALIAFGSMRWIEMPAVPSELPDGDPDGPSQLASSRSVQALGPPPGPTVD